MSTTATAPVTAFALACPACRVSLDLDLDDSTRCPACETTYERSDGIWRFLPPERATYFAQFEREYHTVRRAEGWGSDDSEYYRALPWQDRTGRFTELWRIRAASYRAFAQHVLVRSPLRIVDLGAGNCWLAYRLAQRGHQVAAVDIQIDPRDGLGAWRHYDASFTAIQAEFDRLPLADACADVVVFNGALHYSTDYATSIAEALRVLDPSGVIAVLDSPMYPASANGAAMVDERQTRFQRTYGFASDALPSEHYLTPARLAHLGVSWQIVRPWRGWRWAIRPYWARVRRRRVPADFPVLIGGRA